MSNIKSYFTKNYGMIWVVPTYIVIVLLRFFLVKYKNLLNFLYLDSSIYVEETSNLLFYTKFAILLFIIITTLFLTLTYYYFKTYAHTFLFVFFIVCFINTHIILVFVELFLLMELKKDSNIAIDEAMDFSIIFVLPIEIFVLLCFAYSFDRIKNIRL